MKQTLQRFVSGGGTALLVIVFSICSTQAGNRNGTGSSYLPGSSSESTSADSIRNCPPENWCAYHRTTDKAWRHSPLTEITKDNVSQLKLAWVFLPGGGGVGSGNAGIHSTPIAIGGNVYVSHNPSTIWKLNGATGERIWAFVPEMDEAVVARSVFAHSPGVSIGDGRLYMGLADGRVVAIDPETAEIIWDRKLVSSQKDTGGFSGAATFVNSDLLVIGQSSEYTTEGRFFGLNPRNGDLKWTFYTWGGDSWKYGGGPWQPGAVDYANNQILIGTSNPDPVHDYCGDRCRDPNPYGGRHDDIWTPLP